MWYEYKLGPEELSLNKELDYEDMIFENQNARVIGVPGTPSSYYPQWYIAPK